MPKRVTSGEAPLHGLVPGQHNPKETSQRWPHCVRLNPQPDRESNPRPPTLTQNSTNSRSYVKNMFIVYSIQTHGKN